MAAAAAAVLVLFDRAVFAADVIPLSLEIIRMAGSAIGCELAEPIRYVLIIVVMTGATVHIAVVITRIVAACRMGEVDRRPAPGGVTIVTLGNRSEVIVQPLGFAVDGSHAIVAGAAAIRDALVIKSTSHKGRGGVTVGAIQSGRYMVRRHPPSCNAVTRRAVARYPGMIERCRHKAGRGVADAAVLIGRHVIVAFAGGESGIVAGRTIVHDTLMIKGARYEARGHVAVAAIAVGRYMIVGLTGCCGSVVAGTAVIDDTLMIKVGVGERRGRVAHRAILAGRNVRWVDLGILAGRSNAVVARSAFVDDAVVIEKRRRESAAGHVAAHAILSGHNVIELGILAGRVDTVVA